MALKFSSLLSKVVIILTALLFSQFPAFENSYSQRLGGHIDELRYQIELIQEIAKQSGKTLDEFIIKFISNSDEDFQRQGKLMHDEKMRLVSLENALFNLDNATPLNRPFVFFIHADSNVMKATFHKYHFSLPLTIEGLIWAVMGAFCGFFIFIIFARFFRWVKRVLRRKKTSPQNIEGRPKI